jgi:hypothetical protein
MCSHCFLIVVFSVGCCRVGVLCSVRSSEGKFSVFKDDFHYTLFPKTGQVGKKNIKKKIIRVKQNKL